MGRALSALTGRNRRGGGAGSASARAAEGPGTEEGDVETGLAGPARGGLRTGGRADRPSPPLQRVEGPAPLQGPRRHAWWRRWVEGVEWCLGVIPTATLDRGTGTVEEKKERVYASIAEREAAECAVRGVDDPSELFWLGRPVLVMWLLKFVFFENALSLALILLRTWTGVGEWRRRRRQPAPRRRALDGVSSAQPTSSLSIILPQSLLLTPPALAHLPRSLRLTPGHRLRLHLVRRGPLVDGPFLVDRGAPLRHRVQVRQHEQRGSTIAASLVWHMARSHPHPCLPLAGSPPARA